MTRRVVIEPYKVGTYEGLQVVDRDGDHVTVVRTDGEADLVKVAYRWRALNGIEAPVTRLVVVEP